MGDPSVEEDISICARRAVELAREGFGITLDYSEASLKEVERILARYHDTLPRGMLGKVFRKTPSQQQIQDAAMVWGCYIGEVVRRRWGGEWTTQTPAHPEPVVTLRVLGSDIFPPAKAFKRIVNGAEDNIWHYYCVLKRDFEQQSPNTGS